MVFAGGIKANFYDPAKTTVNHMQFGTVMQEVQVLDPATGEPVIDQKTRKPKTK